MGSQLSSIWTNITKARQAVQSDQPVLLHEGSRQGQHSHHMHNCRMGHVIAGVRGLQVSSVSSAHATEHLTVLQGLR